MKVFVIAAISEMYSTVVNVQMPNFEKINDVKGASHHDGRRGGSMEVNVHNEVHAKLDD